MHYFLGLEVWQSSKGIFLNQGKYRDIEEIQYVGMKSHGHTHGLHPELLADESLELVDVTHYR